MNSNQNPIPAVRQLFAKGKYAEAMAAAKKAAKNSRYRNEASCIEAACLHRLGKPAQAETQLRALVKLGYATPEVRSILAITCRAQGNLPEARDILSQLSKDAPEYADAWHNLSVVLFELADPKEGLTAAQKALQIRGENADAYLQAGRCALQLRDADLTEKYYGGALKVKPGLAECYNGLGGAALIRNKPEEALEHFRQAIELQPNLASAQANRALALKFLGQFAESEACLGLARQLDPKNPEHEWNQSLIQLTQGKFEEGFKAYEVRYDPRRLAQDRVKPPVTKIPMLKNEESARGLTVAVIPEQGLGDTIQFVSLTRRLKAEGANVVLVTAEPLAATVATVPWVDGISTKWSFNGTVDRWIFVTSLGYRYIKSESDIPADGPYIFPIGTKVDKWKKKLGDEGRNLRVAVVWAGRPTHSNDSNRSIALKDLAYLANIPNIQLYSVQMGERVAEIADCGFAIADLSPDIHDFSDTAAILTQMDLLVTIDSSPAHLAGALDVPAMVLIPKIFDFRWLIDRTDTPWYKSLRLCRQSAIGDWTSVHTAIRAHVTQMAEAKSRADTWPRREATTLFEPERTGSVWDSGINLQMRKAVAAHQDDRLNEAEKIYQWILRFQPENVDALRNLGVVYRRTKRLELARDVYERALKLAPQDNLLKVNYTNYLCEVGQEKKAEQTIREVLAQEPNNGSAMYLLALSLENQTRSAEAWPVIQRACELNPHRADYRTLKGISAFRAGHPTVAYPLLEEALLREPHRLDVHLIMAQYYQGERQYDKAEAHYRKASTLAGNQSMTYMNWGGLAIHLGHYEQARALTEKSLALDPDNADARFNLSLLDLMAGNFKQGWAGYEERINPTRRAKDRIRAPALTRPRWQGQDLQGKVLLIYPEQGFGDSIQFLRYVDILKAKGATVWVALRDALVPLLRELPSIDRVLVDGEAVSGYDYWCLPLSLPAYLTPTVDSIPNAVPYLRVPEDKRRHWNSALGRKASVLRVAFAWSGSRNHGNDAQRSTRLEDWSELLAIPGIEWISLNREASDNDRAILARYGVNEVGTGLKDFADSAGILSHVDLLISVDSAPVHLAGALAVPVWNLLPHSADFRWMLDRTDSPWYPTMRLVRQSALHDWAPVFETVKQGLLQRLAALQARPKPARHTLAVCWPLDPASSVGRCIAHTYEILRDAGARWRLANPPIQAEPSSRPQDLWASLTDEWLTVEARFGEVWARQRTVVLDGAIGVYLFDEQGRPQPAAPVQTQRRWAVLHPQATASAATALAAALNPFELVLVATDTQAAALKQALPMPTSKPIRVVSLETSSELAAAQLKRSLQEALEAFQPEPAPAR